MAVITGVDHPAIAVKDVEAAAEWYCRILDYQLATDIEGGAWLLESDDGVFLELMPQDENERQERTVFSSGFSHLAFRVENIDKAIADLEGRGVSWLNEIGEAVGGGRLRNFADPDGNILQIVER